MVFKREIALTKGGVSLHGSSVLEKKCAVFPIPELKRHHFFSYGHLTHDPSVRHVLEPSFFQSFYLSRISWSEWAFYREAFLVSPPVVSGSRPHLFRGLASGLSPCRTVQTFPKHGGFAPLSGRGDAAAGPVPGSPFLCCSPPCFLSAQSFRQREGQAREIYARSSSPVSRSSWDRCTSGFFSSGGADSSRVFLGPTSPDRLSGCPSHGKLDPISPLFTFPDCFFRSHGGPFRYTSLIMGPCSVYFADAFFAHRERERFNPLLSSGPARCNWRLDFFLLATVTWLPLPPAEASLARFQRMGCLAWPPLLRSRPVKPLWRTPCLHWFSWSGIIFFAIRRPPG